MRVADGFSERLIGRRTTFPVAGTIEMVYLTVGTTKEASVIAVVVICADDDGALSSHFANGVKLVKLQ
jgi:hypothetical protein